MHVCVYVCIYVGVCVCAHLDLSSSRADSTDFTVSFSLFVPIIQCSWQVL